MIPTGYSLPNGVVFAPLQPDFVTDAADWPIDSEKI